jgi:AcrR family transcriptional regulator
MTGKQFTSVWLREPRKSTSPGRSREEIVSAAMELLDAEGLNGLSMRKLGAKLSSGATSLYWYVANKDELLELAYDQIWGEIDIPAPEEADWRVVVSAAAHSMRRVMLRHPWSADLIGRLPALGPNALAMADKLIRAFKLGGFGGLEIDYAYATLSAFVFGMTIPEIAWSAATADQDYDADKVHQSVAGAAADYPDLSQRLSLETYQDPDATREMCFAFGLATMLDGLERRLVT